MLKAEPTGQRGLMTAELDLSPFRPIC